MENQMKKVVPNRSTRSLWIERLVSMFVIFFFLLIVAMPLVLWSIRIYNGSVLFSLSDSASVSSSSSGSGSGLGSPCYCDCLDDEDFLPISCGTIRKSNSSTDGEPEMEEMKKNMTTLIKEEMSLLKNVTDDKMQQYKSMIKKEKKTSSHYQNEAEKCNMEVKNCEKAREKAQEELIREQKLTALWKQRARKLASP